MYKGRNIFTEMVGMFPLDRVQRLVVSVVLAVTALIVSPIFGPAESFSNPALTLWYFFGVQATVIIGFLMSSRHFPYPALWKEQFVLGSLGIAAGSFLLFQTLPMEANLWMSFFIGCALGLVFTGILNVVQAVPPMQKARQKRAEQKALKQQEMEMVAQRALASIARLTEGFVVQRNEEELWRI